MPAYVCAEVEIHDLDTYDKYKKLAPLSIAQYGGRYVARGGATEALEGEWAPKRFVIVEFDSMDAARAWYSSPEYSAARAIRERSATAKILLVEGLPLGWTPP